MALYTKKLIMTTFQEMLAEMPFDKITVSALVKRAEGSPNTFYYHYQDIYALLDDWFQKQVDALVPAGEPIEWKPVTKNILRECRAHSKTIYHVFDSLSGTDWIRCLKTSCTAPFRTPNKLSFPQGLPRKGSFLRKKENCANLRIEPTVLKFGGSGRFRHGIRVQIPLNL